MKEPIVFRLSGPGGLYGLAGLAVLLGLSCGCATMINEFYSHSPPRLVDPKNAPPVPAPVQPPRELNKISLPAYRIEPPDVISIEMLKMIPIPPYRIEIYDVLAIRVLGTLLDQPIDGYYLVDADGTVDLGPAYGRVRIAGMTLEEARQTITRHLEAVLRQPEVSLQLARASGIQPVTGTYLVGPDGTINLRAYGTVRVAGMTLVEAKQAIERHLTQYFDSPEVAVDVVGYNSKVYYIITQGAGMGDNVIRVPITGNETVLDALSQVRGLSQLSSKQIWIARPAPPELGCQQILPVDWDAITQGGMTATNYQILPGDRIYIAQDEAMAWSNFISKIFTPVERVAGVAGLGASTIRQFQYLGEQGGGGGPWW
ncbi:MAG: polysaccharide biosynthesis/export family protein [Thermoguttaceae bacterium]|nr:polysaccharide biosynthesis/export family protein [Thermoguttaceae bacterium]MDW8038869.1 polysaccharide biosynthesis/export family protein [Thermoguttaceae bacterium]